jgi:two-component system nitrate/nitrite sensor histidine kinase NarX
VPGDKDERGEAMGRLRKRLGWKIGLLLSTIVLLVMACLSVGDYLWQKSVFLDNLDSHMAEEAWTATVFLQHVEDPLQRQRLLKELARTIGQEQPERNHEIFILDNQARVQASSQDMFVGQRMDTEPVLRVLRGEASFASGVMQHGDHASFYGVVPLYAGGDSSASQVGAVHVAEPMQPLQAYLRQFLTQRLFFLGLVTSILIIFVNLLINKTVQAPLRVLAGTMEKVYQGDLQTRIQVKTSDELGQIGTVFNAMIQAVQEGQAGIERERSRLALLYDISRRLASTADWKEVVELLIRVPSEVVDAVGCTFLSFDERSGRLSLEQAWGLEDEYLLNLELDLQRTKDPHPCLACRPHIARAGTGCSLFPPHLVDGSGAGSILCLHLAQAEQTVGFLNVYLAGITPPRPEKVQLLNAIAGEMAAVVAAAQLRARELALLSSLDQAVRTPLDLGEMLEQIVTQTREASRVAQAALFLYHQPTGNLRPTTVQGIPREQLERLQALASRTIARREPLLITEPSLEDGRRPTKDEPASVLIVPLVLEEKVLGAFLLADQRPQAFTQRQVTLLSAIANQTALITRNSQLYARLESQAILEERSRLAREIHDGLVQTLGYLKLQISRMQGWVEKDDLDRLRVEISDLRDVLEEAYAEARDAITGLRVEPGVKDTLESILAGHVQSFSARYQLPVELSIEGDGRQLQPAVVLHLLRIVQEGLTNIRKHAQASRAWVDVRYRPEGLTLTISDDGRGIDPQAMQQAGLRGLQFMRERAKSLDGRLAIHPRQPQGTEVRITIRNDKGLERRNNGSRDELESIGLPANER